MQLTDAHRTLQAKTGKVEWLRDDEIKGFAIKVSASGRRAYYIHIRDECGEWKPRKLADCALMEIKEARKTAGALKLKSEMEGIDPFAHAKAKRAEPTLTELLDAYEVEKRGLTSSTRKDIATSRKRLDAEWGSRRVGSITVADVKRFFRPLIDRHPATAINVLKAARGAWQHAIDARLISDLPCPFAIRKPQMPVRHRALSDDEYRLLLPWFDRYWQWEFDTKQTGQGNVRTPHRDQCVAALEIVAYSGKRRGAIMAIRKDHIDWHNGIVVTDDKMHEFDRLIMSARLKEMFRRAFSRYGDDPSRYLLPLAANKTTLINQMLTDLCGLAQIEHVTIHDLRRSFNSLGVRHGHEETMMGRLLGHLGKPGTRPTVNQRHYVKGIDEPLRQISDQIATILDGYRYGNISATV